MDRASPAEPRLSTAAAPLDSHGEALFRPRHGAWTLVAFGAIALVGVVDYLTGPEITFSPFYLVPVAIAAWLHGTKVAVAASCFAAVAWLVAEYSSSRVDADNLVYAWNFCARLLFLLLVALLLARLHTMLRRERMLSRTDLLTGLLNARSFREAATIEVERARRYAQPISVAFVDIDNFKAANDRRGHAAGDALLRFTANVLRGNLRSSDIVARYGGDEFVLLLLHADEEIARRIIDKLCDRLASTRGTADEPVTLSIGVASFVRDLPDIDQMLECADRLMYEVKGSAKDSTRYATFPS